MRRAQSGVALSMAVERQRRLLDEVGQRVGTRVAYLKSAWADAVLYGGQGERSGIDVDVLVHPARFEAYASALTELGFVRQVHPRHPVSAYAGKDWTFGAPRGLVQVDLHRALAMPPWFDLDGADPLSRAISYPSAQGSILSLCPEDQVVFLAAHHATHAFALDERHTSDVVRLLERWPVDWGTVAARARRAFLSASLALCAEALKARGAAVPHDACRLGGADAIRHRLLRRLVELPSLRRRAPRSSVADLMIFLPALSDRKVALPRFLTRYAAHRAADWWAKASAPGRARRDPLA